MTVVSKDAFYRNPTQHAGRAYHRQKIPDETVSTAGYHRGKDPKAACPEAAVLASPLRMCPIEPEAGRVQAAGLHEHLLALSCFLL